MLLLHFLSLLLVEITLLGDLTDIAVESPEQVALVLFGPRFLVKFKFLNFVLDFFVVAFDFALQTVLRGHQID
jgi:hypothetical protein